MYQINWRDDGVVQIISVYGPLASYCGFDSFIQFAGIVSYYQRLRIERIAERAGYTVERRYFHSVERVANPHR